MKKISSRPGSAILVVLGMTAFLLVSAIAFAAYVRYARLPSSYLRRSSSSRLLAKAAMARAIDAVDIAVNNNPHPGVGTATIPREPYVMRRIENIWHHRVLMGTNGFSTVSMDSDTVSPLCLEALAYIPPPLVNEARFFSRISPTARWHSLDFDTGRYAFCALDVSDYFDVNRMMADVPRSSAPNRRITLAYLFENDRHTSSGSGAATWDTFMEQFRTIDEDSLAVSYNGSKMPLVSMADYNLALGKRGGVGNFKSPFVEYLSRSGGAGFYNTTSEQEEENFRRQTFVTDGWFPKADTSAASAADGQGQDEGDDIERFDLNDGKYQPFAMQFLETERPALSDVVLGKRLQADGTMKWLEHLSGLGCAALYDYLDPDHVPISLAVPTTERVPMICGLEATFPGAKFGVQKIFEPEDVKAPTVVGTTDEHHRRVRVIVKYRIDSSKLTPGFMAGVVKSVVVFPFSHKDTTDGTFNLDGRFSMFFTSEKMTLRTGEANDVLHFATPMIANTAFDAKNGLMNVKLQDQALSFTGRITSEEQAVKEVESRLNAQAMGPYLSQNGNELLTVTYEWDQTDLVGGVATGNWTPEFAKIQEQGGEYITAAHCGIPALKANGTVDPQFTDANIVKTVQGGNANGPDLRLNAALWMRVKDKNGKIVDMVPACLTDDKIQNQVNDPDPRMALVGQKEFAGQPFPVFRLDTGVEFKLSIEKLEAMVSADTEVKITPEAAIVADPRYNYAPEHWFALPGKLTKENWLNENHTGESTGENVRDHDIFMATSDAGYMQSPYEVAHLPRFTNLVKYGNSVAAGYMTAPDGANDASIPNGFAEARNSHLMWLTYDPIDANADAFYNLPWTAAGNGFKVNPYSDSTNILMSVFANTPVDWKRASTNDVTGGESYYDMPVAEFNKQYAFNAYSSDTKIAWRDLEQIAGRFSQTVRSGVDWEDALAKLGNWTSADPDRFCGVALDSETDMLWDADRKFLYGFWNECFANRQQLYLIFVRAEPVMMGSGMSGQMPPQLGARAMALVWRDPRQAKDEHWPHQTRVLFYRQFE